MISLTRPWVFFLVLSLRTLRSSAGRVLRDTDKDIDDELIELMGSDESIVNRTDVLFLASDELGGRDEQSPGSFLAQEYLIDQLQQIGAVGRVSGQSGRDAFKQRYIERVVSAGGPDNGTNILGFLEGSDLPNEYVVLSAHYDGVGFSSNCRVIANSDSTICNAATDNVASIAVVLGIGRKMAALAKRPRRSVMFAFWDGEENFLDGSRYYTDNPLFPLEQISTFVNFDIMGANLLPSLREDSFIIGAESGGGRLKTMVHDAIEEQGLDIFTISAIFGMERSDYFPFYEKEVPFVFFTDANGPCYHTSGDEIKIVDFDKLEKQARIALKLTYKLLNTFAPPSFEPACLIPATYSDLSDINDAANSAVEDILLFPEDKRDELLFYQSELNCLTRWGPVAFPFIVALDTSRFVDAVGGIVDLLLTPECDGFLKTS